MCLLRAKKPGMCLVPYHFSSKCPLDGKSNCFLCTFGDKPPRACSGPKQPGACLVPYHFSSKCPLGGKSNCFPHTNSTPSGRSPHFPSFVLTNHDNSTLLKRFTNLMTAFSWSAGK